jgi:carbonic anhydrase
MILTFLVGAHRNTGTVNHFFDETEWLVFSYSDPNTQEQIDKVRSHACIAIDVPVRGFIFDVETGLLREVPPIAQQIVG